MPTALILIDVINPFDFDGAERMVARAEEAAGRIRELKERARAAGLPVLYCNDHFGNWQEDFSDLVARCRQPGAPGHVIADRLAPQPEDYHVLKPKHSAFFRSPLATLLDHLEIDRLILCGFSGDMCVLATAFGAHMRDYRLAIPADCTASIDPHENERALAYASRVFGADVRPGAEVELG
jgi:nicotinamidase-related amidase